MCKSVSIKSQKFSVFVIRLAILFRSALNLLSELWTDSDLPVITDSSRALQVRA
jgi:hypothetical protein